MGVYQPAYPVRAARRHVLRKAKTLHRAHFYPGQRACGYAIDAGGGRSSSKAPDLSAPMKATPPTRALPERRRPHRIAARLIIRTCQRNRSYEGEPGRGHGLNLEAQIAGRARHSDRVNVQAPLSWKKETSLLHWLALPGAQVAAPHCAQSQSDQDANRGQEKAHRLPSAPMRHGSRMADGSLDGELIPGDPAEFGPRCCRDFSAVTQIDFDSGDGVDRVLASSPAPQAVARVFLTDGVEGRHGRCFHRPGLEGNNARNFWLRPSPPPRLTLAVIDGGAAIADIGSADESCFADGPGQTHLCADRPRRTCSTSKTT